MTLAESAWQTLRDHLDALPLRQVLDSLLVDAILSHGEPVPRACPRSECRSTRLSHPGTWAWQCWTCGAHGASAALLAASVAGWMDADPSPRALQADLPSLLREALCCGLIPVDDPKWVEMYRHYPEATDERLRGIFTGPERTHRMRRLAAYLIRSGLAGDAVVDLVLSHNHRKCRPPLTREELADAVNAAAMETAQ